MAIDMHDIGKAIYESMPIEKIFDFFQIFFPKNLIWLDPFRYNYQ